MHDHALVILTGVLCLIIFLLVLFALARMIYRGFSARRTRRLDPEAPSPADLPSYIRTPSPLTLSDPPPKKAPAALPVASFKHAVADVMYAKGPKGPAPAKKPIQSKPSSNSLKSAHSTSFIQPIPTSAPASKPPSNQSARPPSDASSPPSKPPSADSSSGRRASKAVMNEEQLLGLGQLPRDVQLEQQLKELEKKIIGPPGPTL
ncbi:hypothetical protein AAVH_20520 [Aphelenchoides avenae]|nr:hypothetical protein AAVH_20520 [Aphelenchus avenae]